MRAIMRIVVLAIGLAGLLVSGSAFAADDKPLPPPNAKKLSESSSSSRNATAYDM